MPEIQMPKLSDTMTEGTLVAWKKKKGDQVTAGDVIAEIETDKATMEWESPEDGVLSEIFVEEGGKVEVGEKIAFIGGKDAAAPSEPKTDSVPSEQPVKSAEPQKQPAETEQPAAAEEKNKGTAPPQQDEQAATRLDAGKAEAPPEAEAPPKAEAAPHQQRQSEEARVKASPLARRLAAEQGLDISQVKGSGPEGRITETDVRAAMKSQSPAAAAPQKQQTTGVAGKSAEGARIHLSGMRKVIAERLVASKGPVPHFYLSVEIDAGPLMAARAELKAGGEGSDTAKITVNDFIVKAAVAAAVKVPKANASFDDDAIVQYQDVDLAIAVAIEDGLVTPVVRAAQGKSLREISEAVKDLAHRARNKRMKPEEFQGGTFTVSNLGSYGIDSFSAIINPPQGFILAIGGVSKRAVVDDYDQISVGHRMAITMSCDHRVIDGALGAEYLKELRLLLENPTLLLV
ncbi:MAG: pyruvate dehydrogenase complex dihydrolipoamide acetyltransferase [Chthoniobacterales bacterium]|nr:pyruvate dehydrogenase complex dihydrolipoamide acetyltransferase [Chthoniobacterales bacterium]